MVKAKKAVGITLLAAGLLWAVSIPGFATETLKPTEEVSEIERNVRSYILHCVIVTSMQEKTFEKKDLFEASERGDLLELITRDQPTERDAPFYIYGAKHWLACNDAAPLLKEFLPRTILGVLNRGDFTKAELADVKEGADRLQKRREKRNA